MRKTSNDYFKKYNTADLTVIGSMGIDDDNASAINSLQGIENVEYGYLKDVVIEQTSKSCRIFSLGENISEYEVISGRLPEKSDEIAFSDASKENYKLEPVHIKIASKIIASVRLPKYSASSLS